MAKFKKPKYTVECRRLESVLQFVREWSSWSDCQTLEEAEQDLNLALEIGEKWNYTGWEYRIRKL
ncbi:hypothetical protein CPT_Mendera_166 [Stenotrophomonas phage Mendera]|uniref:Uncharacterized protein n=3 Tax=Menderavirus TaxID=2843421 RepID=A0A0H4INH0_9CAUD|nr:hypothetical protein HWC11_gp135 [Stenotrophomonas phage YB07]YP_009851200.1 hypothetical protein HWC60_gp249 [Stenotrophomonas phage Mendera]YP_010077755.1 hypothetical protein KMC40_gp196 [Stenotrophomonas phage IME-SM1]QXN67243.1 hypothetical protein [Stenotrophomonas phage BUCT608]AKO61562.1 hypothetical protein [Stenotrophomonas phage IME-SM1]QBP06331.1 hypothetical protein [Stenotrophomonas phage YB07]QFR56692.1 hypothetical protein CPT_Mendera_166 [Stenotrophomonas phage Mendera]QY